VAQSRARESPIMDGFLQDSPQPPAPTSTSESGTSSRPRLGPSTYLFYFRHFVSCDFPSGFPPGFPPSFPPKRRHSLSLPLPSAHSQSLNLPFSPPPRLRLFVVSEDHGTDLLCKQPDADECQYLQRKRFLRRVFRKGGILLGVKVVGCGWLGLG